MTKRKVWPITLVYSFSVFIFLLSVNAANSSVRNSNLALAGLQNKPMSKSQELTQKAESENNLNLKCIKISEDIVSSITISKLTNLIPASVAIALLRSSPQETKFLSYAERVNLAKQYINQNQGKKALDTIAPLLLNQPTYEVLIIAAQGTAEQNDPLKALDYFTLALKQAKAPDEQAIAEQGIVKMQTWIKQNKQNLQLPSGETNFLPYAERINLAKQYINQNQGKKALDTLLPLLNQPNFEVLIMAAQGTAEENDPLKALDYFTLALKQAKDPNEQAIAKQGIVKMQTWITQKQNLQANSTETSSAAYSQQINLAKQYINQNQGKKALDTLLPLLLNQPTFEVLIIAGQGAAEQNDPLKALNYFSLALKKANGSGEQAIAERGIAKMQTWITQNAAKLQASQQLEKTTLYNQKIALIKEYINANKGAQALEALNSLPDKKMDYDILILYAQASAEVNQPLESLAYYSLASKLAKSSVEKKLATLGIAKMQAWVKADTITNTKNKANKVCRQPELPCDKYAREGESALTFNQRIALAKKYIESDKGKQALEILEPILKTKINFEVLILAAKAYAEIERPISALDYYKLAYKIAATTAELHLAEFGIARMQFWLSHYFSAFYTYYHLLTDGLTGTDYELAKAGEVKSLAYADRAITAYREIPFQMTFKTPEMLVAAAQATLWADQADLTKQLIETYPEIINKIKPKSILDNDLRDVIWQMNLNTNPNKIAATMFISRDSEAFQIIRSNLNYSHYWSQVQQSYFGLEDIHYDQIISHLTATGFYVAETWRPTRELILNGRLNPMNYKLWQPFLWSTNINYRPTDFFGIQLLALKEVVETFPAFTQHITDNQYAAGITLKPLPYVKVDASLSRLNFSDTNIRNTYYVAASFLVSPNFGINLILQERAFTDKFVSRLYFSPNRYVADTLIVRWSSKAGSYWHYYIDGGLGTQLIKNNGSEGARSPTRQWGLGINGPITDNLILNAYYAMTNQASAFINTPDYRYQYGAVTLTWLI
ncbi:hypothetical protein ACNVED_02555 [Legionella sp. D16C41]|uniref:hypothetical protein n=1 Tax=Legionella sp. D16C41 TaxID=3402688 RepID=UPI003AF9DAE3